MGAAPCTVEQDCSLYDDIRRAIARAPRLGPCGNSKELLRCRGCFFFCTKQTQAMDAGAFAGHRRPLPGVDGHEAAEVCFNVRNSGSALAVALLLQYWSVVAIDPMTARQDDSSSPGPPTLLPLSEGRSRHSVRFSSEEGASRRPGTSHTLVSAVRIAPLQLSGLALGQPHRPRQSADRSCEGTSMSDWPEPIIGRHAGVASC
jgi:hypothetical protein